MRMTTAMFACAMFAAGCRERSIMIEPAAQKPMEGAPAAATDSLPVTTMGLGTPYSGAQGDGALDWNEAPAQPELQSRRPDRVVRPPSRPAPRRLFPDTSPWPPR